MIVKIAGYVKTNYDEKKIIYKFAFLSAIIIGLFTHIYIFTNKFLNDDDIFYSGKHSLNQISLGRWFLGLLTGISKDYSMPAVIGTLSILYMALAAVVLCYIFNVKNKISALLIGGIIAAYPVNAGIFSFMFLSDGYFGGIFLAVMGVLFLRLKVLSEKYTMFRYFLSVVCFVFVLGTYQAYIGIVCGLMVICLIIDTVQGIFLDTDTIQILKKGVIYLAILLISFVSYGIIVYFTLTLSGTELTRYQNFNSITTFSLATYLKGILNSYQGFYNFLCLKNYGSFNVLLFILHITAVVISIITMFNLLKTCCKNHKQKKNFKTNLLLLLFLCFILPPAVESIYIIAAKASNLHWLTKYASILWYFLFIKIIDILIQYKLKFFKITAIMTAALIVFESYLFCNLCYYRMQITKDEVVSVVNRLAAKIEEIPGYSPDSIIWISLRDESNENLFNRIIPDFEEISGTTGILTEKECFTERLMPNLLKYYAYLSYNLPDKEQIIKIKNSVEYRNMPQYPETNSIKIINDIIVVKLSDNMN